MLNITYSRVVFGVTIYWPQRAFRFVAHHVHVIFIYFSDLRLEIGGVFLPRMLAVVTSALYVGYPSDLAAAQ
jgi:hypothetical protein